MKVTARIWTDDRVIDTEVDIEIWLNQASDKEILDVVESGFGLDYSCDRIAYHMANYNGEVAKMFQYLDIIAGKKDVGFEVNVDKFEMIEWLKENKLELYKEKEQEIRWD